MITYYWAYCYCCSKEFDCWESLHNHMVKSDHSMIKHAGEKYATPCLDLTHKSI